MVQIKFLFNEWRSVEQDEAKQYIVWLLEHITAMSNQDKINYINDKFLKGIKVQEIMEVIE